MNFPRLDARIDRLDGLWREVVPFHVPLGLLQGDQLLRTESREHARAVNPQGEVVVLTLEIVGEKSDPVTVDDDLLRTILARALVQDEHVGYELLHPELPQEEVPEPPLGAFEGEPHIARWRELDRMPVPSTPSASASDERDVARAAPVQR
jgi:hypothetical protein